MSLTTPGSTLDAAHRVIPVEDWPSPLGQPPPWQDRGTFRRERPGDDPDLVYVEIGKGDFERAHSGLDVHISTCVPTSMTCSGGRPKKRAALVALRCMSEKRRSRTAKTNPSLPGITVSCPMA